MQVMLRVTDYLIYSLPNMEACPFLVLVFNSSSFIVFKSFLVLFDWDY